MYEYPNQASQYENMLKSNSKGKWVWRNLRRKNVLYRKIGVLPLPDDIGVTDEEIFQEIDNRYMADLTRHVDVPVFQSFEFIKGINYQKIQVGNINVYKAITSPLEILQQPTPTINVNFDNTNTLTEMENTILNVLKDDIKITKVNVIKPKGIVAEKHPVTPKLIEKYTKEISILTQEYKSDIVEINFGRSAPNTLGAVERYGSGKECVYNLKHSNQSLVISDYNSHMKNSDINKNFGVAVDDENKDVAVLYHEFAHSIVSPHHINVYGGSESELQFVKELNTVKKKYVTELNKLKKDIFLEKDEVKKEILKNRLAEINISEYALTTSDEFLAEAFAMGKLNTKPSPYAKDVVNLINKYYKK
jgi:hypothetical protein